MCVVCNEIRTGSMQASLYAAGLSGVAVGVKLSWRQVAARVRTREGTMARPTPAEDARQG
jgi:hypothetical protein